MAKQNLPVWDLVGSVIEHSRTTLLHGPSGTGKSHAAHGADLGGRALYSVTLTPETPAAELRGHYVPVGSEFRWQDGPAIRAWREGARLVINEVDHAGGDALSFLLNCLDVMSQKVWIDIGAMGCCLFEGDWGDSRRPSGGLPAQYA
jgi:MoxR-like ATPase